MLLHILHPGILPHVEAVDSVMLGILVPAVVNAAPRHDDDVRAFADEEIIIYDFLQPALGHHHRNMDTFVFGARFDPDLQSADVLFGDNLNIGCGLPSGRHAVGTDIVSAFGHFMKISHLPEQPLLNLIQFQHSASSFPAGLNGPSHKSAISLRIRWGYTSSLLPCFSTTPLLITMISSAMFRILS